MKRLFWNAGEQRLRSFWRLLLTIVICFAFSMLPLLALAQIPMPHRLVFFVAPCITLLGTFAGIGIAARFLDHRPLTDFGLSLDGRWWADLCFGLLLGVLLIAGVFLIERTAGWIEIVGWFHRSKPDESFWTVLSSLAVLFVCVGIYEELAFRGYLLRNIAEGLNFPVVGSKGALLVALLITAAMFGVVHATNPHASAASVINTVLSGILFGLAYLLTGRLGIPIGLHITWNFCQGPIFGFPVSGVEFGEGMLATVQSGPVLWTGGDYGPEGGLIGTGAMLIGTALMVAWVRFRYSKLLVDRSLAQPPAPPPSHEDVEEIEIGRQDLWMNPLCDSLLLS